MRKAKLLIVEDEPAVLKMNKQFFELQGYDVITAMLLAEAREAVAKYAPDLILLDVQMPDGNGFDFCKEIRAATTAPIVFLTCQSDSQNIVRGLSLGGDGYIVKPYDINVLGARVAAHLRRSGMFSSGRIEFPPLMIDIVAGNASLHGQSINLSKKELQLLIYLASNTGQRIHKDELYETVWGEKPNNATHTVTEHISRLRKKLKMDEEKSPFQITAEGKYYIFSKVLY
ncbi:response regulator transcription factor [Eubacteriales bacterium OttesenSCG-928-K08]|nr:response regulator transcription factor [Eubacteriales bacterium OttesenSCG-928-K08]